MTKLPFQAGKTPTLDIPSSYITVDVGGQTTSQTKILFQKLLLEWKEVIAITISLMLALSYFYQLPQVCM